MSDQVQSTPETTEVASTEAAEVTETTNKNTESTEATDITAGVETEASSGEVTADQVAEELSKEASVEKIKDPQKPQKRLYRVKIDGQEMEVDESELLAGYQRARAANKRFEEAAKQRKQAEYFLKLLRTDPVKVLEHPEVGHDVRQLAESYLAEIIKREKMSPEQREKEDLKQQLKALEEEKKAIADARKQEQMVQLQAHYEEDYTNKIVGALDQGGLPKTPYTVKRMAQHMYNAMERGYEVEPSDVVSIVKEEYQEDFKNFFNSMEGEALINILGKDVVDRIRKAELAKVKAKTPAVPAKTKETAQPQKKETKAQKKMTMEEFNEEMKKYLE